MPGGREGAVVEHFISRIVGFIQDECFDIKA